MSIRNKHFLKRLVNSVGHIGTKTKREEEKEQAADEERQKQQERRGKRR